ncbi:hypothetical protein LSH36_610g01039, partial [Paralvinella palmiformis]
WPVTGRHRHRTESPATQTVIVIQVTGAGVRRVIGASVICACNPGTLFSLLYWQEQRLTMNKLEIADWRSYAESCRDK